MIIESLISEPEDGARRRSSAVASASLIRVIAPSISCPLKSPVAISRLPEARAPLASRSAAYSELTNSQPRFSATVSSSLFRSARQLDARPLSISSSVPSNLVL